MARHREVEDEMYLPIRTSNPYRAGLPTTRSLKLLDLPNELLGHVLTFLDSNRPSENSFVEHPASSWTICQEHPLKNFSTLSHRLRSLTLPLLFRHVRLDPYHLSPFLAFIRQTQLTDSVISIVAHLQGPCNHIHPAWWCRLLNEIPATCFTIACAPHIFAEIAKINMNMNDIWAFNIQYQYLELHQTLETAHQRISYNSMPSLFVARPWHILRVNEGSSLSAYSSYEYFLKKPPSIMADLQFQLASLPPTSLGGNLDIDRMPLHPTQQLLEGLVEFSFIAIFPFYNHVDDILKCIRRMKRLKKLFMKLGPEPSSTILEDEIKAANYHIDLNDPWTE